MAGALWDQRVASLSQFYHILPTRAKMRGVAAVHTTKAPGHQAFLAVLVSSVMGLVMDLPAGMQRRFQMIRHILAPPRRRW